MSATGITDEMIEQAAREMFAAGAENAAHEHDLYKPITWEDVSDRDHDHWCLCTRAALEAIAPLIAAQALRDAADGYQTGGWADDLPAGSSRPALILGMSQRAVAWLRNRAHRIEQGARP